MKIKHSSLIARKNFLKGKNKNLKFLLKQRFTWMNSFIKKNWKGIEFGAGAGFSQFFIKSKNFEISDYENYKYLDFKKKNAEKTDFKKNSYNFVIACNMIHHLNHPLKFFYEVHRILKKNGRLIIFDANGSFFLKLILKITKHEHFNKNINIWNEKKSIKSLNDPWIGNNAVCDLIFEDKNCFKKNIGKKFKIIYEEKTEFLIFLNSGGIYFKTYFIPLSYFSLKLISIIDTLLVFLFPSIFALGRKIVLEKV